MRAALFTVLPFWSKKKQSTLQLWSGLLISGLVVAMQSASACRATYEWGCASKAEGPGKYLILLPLDDRNLHRKQKCKSNHSDAQLFFVWWWSNSNPAHSEPTLQYSRGARPTDTWAPVRPAPPTPQQERTDHSTALVQVQRPSSGRRRGGIISSPSWRRPLLQHLLPLTAATSIPFHLGTWVAFFNLPLIWHLSPPFPLDW